MPKILTLDIETFGLVVETWGIWEQKILPDQVIKDWCIASWSAKWLDDPPSKIMYKDNRHRKDPRDDKQTITVMHKLMSQADIIVTQNGKKFDLPKLNARFKFHKLKPLPAFRHYDTRLTAKNKFGFTSNSLKELCQYFGVKYQKSEHEKFPGRKLWRECEAKNPEAWIEMEKYNKLDVLATEAIFKELEPWDNSINASVYTSLEKVTCQVLTCKSERLQHRGVATTNMGVFKRYQCKDCGGWTQGRNNLLTKEQKENIRKKG